jgi:hypothetical protein
VRKPPPPVRRQPLALVVMERRIHQHAHRGFHAEAGGHERARRRRDIERDRSHALGEAVAPRILGSEPRELRIDLDQRDRESGDARREREPGRADAGPEIDGEVA